MKIGEFAIRVGISKDTIRYYEKMGLLCPEITSKHREFNEQHIEILSTIVKLKNVGFSLYEIKLLLDWSLNMDHNKELTEVEIQNLLQLQSLFQSKYEEIVRKEKEIKQIKQVLQRAQYKMEQLLEKNSNQQPK